MRNLFFFFQKEKKKEKPWQEPEIGPQIPVEPFWEQFLETVPLNPSKHSPFTICSFARVSFHFELLSLKIVPQFVTLFIWLFIYLLLIFNLVK